MYRDKVNLAPSVINTAKDDIAAMFGKISGNKNQHQKYLICYIAVR